MMTPQATNVGLLMSGAGLKSSRPPCSLSVAHHCDRQLPFPLLPTFNSHPHFHHVTIIIPTFITSQFSSPSSSRSPAFLSSHFLSPLSSRFLSLLLILIPTFITIPLFSFITILISTFINILVNNFIPVFGSIKQRCCNKTILYCRIALRTTIHRTY